MRALLPMILSLSLMTPLAALARGIPDYSNFHAELPEGPLPRFLMVAPDGSGPPLAEARIEGGEVVSAVITLWLINGEGDPIDNYPAEDIWLDDACDGATFCGLVHPDGPTDLEGRTTFSGTFPAGGNMPPGCVIQVLVAGEPLWEPGLELRLVSPDITGDLSVNLSDITLFTQAIEVYTWTADFNVDGAVNLTDITFMAQSIGALCR